MSMELKNSNLNPSQIAIVKMTWDRLSDEDKSTLHTVAVLKPPEQTCLSITA